jgi:hypothetical protein
MKEGSVERKTIGFHARPTLMVRLTNKFGLALLLAVGLGLPTGELAAQTAAPKTGAPATSAKPAKAHPHKKKPARVVEEAPAPAPPPPTLEQMSPTPPEVSYRDGKLSISSQNATLSQVLQSVRAQTGASIEMPGSASSERVVAQLGPGQPRDVLNSLLNGSKFNYVLLGIAGNPGAVQRVILTSKRAASNAATTPPNNTAQMQVPEDEPQDEVIVGEPEPEPVTRPMPPNLRRPQVPMTPRMPEGGNVLPPPNNADNSQPDAKTPEQLLQELQQMQEQQQQMQQQLNPANRGPQ